jgi:hypothetical protein
MTKTCVSGLHRSCLCRTKTRNPNMIKARLKLCTHATIIHWEAYWNSTFLSAYTSASSTTPRRLSSITENFHVTYWFSKCQMVQKLTMLKHNKQKGKSSIYLCPAKTSIEWGKACNHMPVTKNHVNIMLWWEAHEIQRKKSAGFKMPWSCQGAPYYSKPSDAIIADDKNAKSESL